MATRLAVITVLAVGTLLTLGGSPVAAQAPATDIFLLRLTQDSELSDPIRVTQRPEYDNQPMFLPSGSLAYTAMTGDGSTDLLLFDPDTSTTKTLVSTPQSEYSATPVPGRDAVSMIRDYGNEVQQLWSFDLDGTNGTFLLPDINPVGYHAWIDERRLLLFVLGEPATLQVAVVGSGPGKVVARDPGRALARIPGSRQMSFVHKAAEGEWWLTALDPESGDLRRLFRTLPECEDYAWSPDGHVWMADGSRLFRRRPGDREWREVADLSAHGIRGITRLAFDHTGESLALVAQAEAEAQ